jgi:RNA polymerase sigma-70 factor (ECF subfamily)
MSVTAKESAKARDNELLVAVAGGSRRALGDLYLGNHRRLVRFLSRFTSSYENVEEIINDTFLVVWQRAKDFRFASQVSTWIISIAYRTLTKSLRSQKNHLDAHVWGEPAEYADPSISAEAQDWLTHGLSQLPVEQRLTLELAFHMGHSLQEIASITDCSVGTVKARIFHARAKMRRFLPALDGDA